MVDKTTTSSDGASLPNGVPALSFVRPDLLGYVFHLAWIYLLFYNHASTSTAIGGSPLSTNLVYFLSMLALIATLLFGCFKVRRFMKFAQSTPMAFIAPAAMSLGTVAYYLYSLTAFDPFVVLGGIMTGFGSAVLAARWAAVFGNVTTRDAINNFPLILVLIAAISITVEYVSQAIWVTLLVVLPLLSGACLQYAHSYQQRFSNAQPHKAPPSAKKRPASTYVALVALIGLLGLCTGGLSSFSSSGSSISDYYLMFDAISALVVTGFVGFSIFSNQRMYFVPAFVIPLAALILILVPFIQFVASDFYAALYPIGSVAFELMFLFGAVLFALFSDFSPARTFMIARVTLSISDTLGAFLGNKVVETVGVSTGLQVASVLLFACAELLVGALVVSYILSGRNAKRVVTVDQAAAVRTTSSTVAGSPTPTADDRCTAIAQRDGLSERELDVLRLLAQGKSPAAIQSELCIAQGTVNYHMRNIYAKTGVHTRQELMVLLFDGSAQGSTQR